MKAISVRAPWWFAILHCGKTHENRNWATRITGRVGLHASAYWSLSQIQDDCESAAHMRLAADGPIPPHWTFRQMKEWGGHIVGSVEITGCDVVSDSPWFVGEFGFRLANPVPLTTPIPCKGQLGFFEMSDEAVRAIEASLA